MDRIQQFSMKILGDDRAQHAHLALAFAMVTCCRRAGKGGVWRTSRRILMGLSGIKSTATYHYCIQDLQDWGYLLYSPSHHPKNASSFKLCL